MNRFNLNFMIKTITSLNFDRLNRNVSQHFIKALESRITRSLFYDYVINKLFKTHRQLLSNVRFCESELDFDEKKKLERHRNKSKESLKMSIEDEENSLSLDANSLFSKDFKRRFIIESLALVEQEEFVLFNVSLNESIEHFVLDFQTLTKSIRKYLQK